MNTTRTKFLAGVFAAASLAACDGLHAPSAEEIASRKMSDATARVRAIALRTAHSPLAVASTIEEEGGGSREVAKPMLAPAEAAGELRKVASEIESTGGGEAQRRAARDLASRVRRDALVLEVAEFERLAGERDRLEAEARRCEAVAKAIKPSDDAETGAAGDFGARAAQSLGDAIAKLTPGEDLSHASIYDAKRDTVIEAVGSGVREISLAELISRNHYVIVVRPTGMTAADQQRALARARTKVGTAFDKAGLFGLGDDAKFYCSELVWWASETEARSGETERVITPADLMKYGSVIYWSGNRTDPQVMSIAATRPTQLAAR